MNQKLKDSKKYKEVFISLGLESSSESMILEIEKIAKKLHKEGWFFVESKTDEQLSKICLFFEK